MLTSYFDPGHHRPTPVLTFLSNGCACAWRDEDVLNSPPLPPLPCSLAFMHSAFILGAAARYSCTVPLFFVFSSMHPDKVPGPISRRSG